MPETFRTFAELLRPVCAPAEETIAPTPQPCAQPDDALEESDLACDGVLREYRLFRAQLSQALESAFLMLLNDIAADVLGRELQLQEPELQKILRSALARFAQDEPQRIRVHPADRSALVLPVPVEADESLRRGDAILEMRFGHVDARLGVRLAAVLDAYAQ
ncbi:MAG: FliH/SctL family protein [Candidatus Baltobacteraceae bacterium]